ncbi:hypothetical protein SAMN04488085_108118 [Geodermatophilus ruber]|uniref:Uncharacterized protein n=1 Tax=Geodermatophilus ruber TaxID=504800 RepID=A0A1I4G3A9_9ACTN|nr:hypothetical protein SAMN04488085_108118 [Geodermatophilus ruber]
MNATAVLVIAAAIFLWAVPSARLERAGPGPGRG